MTIKKLFVLTLAGVAIGVALTANGCGKATPTFTLKSGMGQS